MTKQQVFEKTFEFTNGYTLTFSDLGDVGLMVGLADKNGAEDSASIILPVDEAEKLRTWLANILVSKDQKETNTFRESRAHHYST